jgi:hypothetical protein
MEIQIKKVANGFVVEVENDTGYTTYIFAKYSQVVKFMKDAFNPSPTTAE